MDKRKFGLALTGLIILANIVIPMEISAKIDSKFGHAGFRFRKKGLLDTVIADEKTDKSVSNIYNIKNK